MVIYHSYCQLGELIDTIKTTNGDIDKLIIKLQNQSAGKVNRQNNPGLAARYPNCVAIERVSNQYGLRKKSGDVGATATVIQFPVKLAFAITSHKIQGQTIPWPMTVVLDLNSIFEDAQAHVMLSRVQRLQQVYILESLDDSKIRTSYIGLKELERLKTISINENPTPWHKQDENMIKVISLNCAGLKAHFSDVQGDVKIKEADIIHLMETSLEENDDSSFILPGHSKHMINVGNGKGIATYFKDGVFRHEQDKTETYMQVTKFTSIDVDVINVYRSDKGNSLTLFNYLDSLITHGKPTLITGDFNICFLNHSGNRLSKGLANKGFIQLVQEATHLRGGHIDHAYWTDAKTTWNQPQLELYTPYYSDHDALCVTLVKQDLQLDSPK